MFLIFTDLRILTSCIHRYAFCWLLRSSQVEAIRRGLATVVPYPMLALLSWDELQTQVCGRPRFDVELLKSQTVYDSDCAESDAHVQLFWRCMRERFDDADRARLLKFVWGQSRLPLRAADFERKFKIQRYRSFPRGRSLIYHAHAPNFALD